MITLKNIGEFKSVPQLVKDIIEGDTLALDQYLASGWDIDQEIEISKYTSLSPIDLSLITGNFDSLKWLVEKGAHLNVKNNPSFLLAVRYCDGTFIKYLMEHGAKIHSVNAVNSEAFQEALFGNKFDNLAIIHALGHSVEKYGGKAFRRAVADRNYQVLDFFIKNGVDINYNASDSVYPFKPTPLCVAARYVDLDMCKYLVEHGADVTLTEKDGMRPYSIAIEKGDQEMAEYFQKLEPVEFHNLRNKLDELKPFKLPRELTDFLMSQDLYFELTNCDFKWIEFFPLMQTIPLKKGRKKFLRISRSTGDYTHIYIIWHPKTNKVAFYDEEHETISDICSFKEFICNMSRHLQEILEG